MENREAGGLLAHEEESSMSASSVWNELMRLRQEAAESEDSEKWEGVWFYLKEQRERYPQLPNWLPGEEEILAEIKKHVPHLSEAINERLKEKGGA